MKLEILEPGPWCAFDFLVVDTDADEDICVAGFNHRPDAELFIGARSPEQQEEQQ